MGPKRKQPATPVTERPGRERRTCISADDAVREMLRFVENSDSDSDDDNDLSSLYGSELEANEDADDISGGEEEIDNRVEEDNHLRRKQLTKNRLVHSIDSALDLENYNVFVVPEEEKVIRGVIKHDNNRNNDEKIEFSNQPGNTRGRQTRANVITGITGLRARAKRIETEQQAFSLYITPDMLQSVIDYTNIKMNKLIAKLPDDFNKDFKYPHVKTIEYLEMCAFIGLCYYRGLYKLNSISIQKLFSEKFGPPQFSATMSRNRFLFILRHLSFDDEETRGERWKKDRFAAFRDFFESFNRNCITSLAPGDYLSLDETLYPMRTQIGFRQFNPNKPAKYGMLFKSVNAARMPYTFIAAPYTGKPVEQGGQFYVQGTEAIVVSLVKGMESVGSLGGRNISFDRLYTSISLERWLYSRNITSVGTLQINRKGIPAEIKEVRNREPLSTEIYWEVDGPLSLSSYVVKTSTGKKNVLLLATHPQVLGTTKDDKKEKAGLYKLYDFTKGGTDIIDQRMGFFTTRTKSRRWTMTSFSYVLDMARVNSSTILALNQNTDPCKTDSFQHCYELSQQLIKPYLEQRSLNGLGWITKQKISLCLGRPLDVPEQRNDKGPHTAPNRERCHICINQNQGSGHKKTKDKMGKIQSLCQSCEKHTCKTHMTQTCDNCKQLEQ